MFGELSDTTNSILDFFDKIEIRIIKGIDFLLSFPICYFTFECESTLKIILIHLLFLPLTLIKWCLKLIVFIVSFILFGVVVFYVELAVRLVKLLFLMFVFAIIVTILVRIFL